MGLFDKPTSSWPFNSKPIEVDETTQKYLYFNSQLRTSAIGSLRDYIHPDTISIPCVISRNPDGETLTMKVDEENNKTPFTLGVDEITSELIIKEK